MTRLFRWSISGRRLRFALHANENLSGATAPTGKRTDRQCRSGKIWPKRLAISACLVGLVCLLAAPGTRGTDSFDLYDQSMNPKSVVRDETTRAVLTPTFGGTTARVRLSNRFGTVPVTFAQATVARRA
jgi:hypothetical protein